jgi:ethanolamine utilization protein EutN
VQICRVVGTGVATQKNKKLEGAKLLLVQPLTLDEQPKGSTLLDIDSVGAGVGEKVLVVIEGKAAGDARQRRRRRCGDHRDHRRRGHRMNDTRWRGRAIRSPG